MRFAVKFRVGVFFLHARRACSAISSVRVANFSVMQEKYLEISLVEKL
jgi:hypothetical protein